MTQPSQEARVTHRFAVELTDYLEACPGARLMTRDEAREVLDGVLYEGDKHHAFALSLVDEEAHDG
ncbi:hypothetical protein [Streptomyces sp. Wh19]|uniref:hypothetical protein n=1 Tax=Streptomyces sp. Wh19 TaxID=3076629 RepID=UPI0029585012|nr:hypothetical protein [Streptomyces sp. Wh19]MDV9197034.1 hypothetical protein [Streptomyces sp. Wh19]